MDILNPLFLIIATSLALITGFLINRKYAIYSSEGRFGTIDGLRGFLAFFVFVHHSVACYQYIYEGRWMCKGSRLYDHLGGTSVSFFFMITGFLFINKILNSKDKGINWKNLYTKRVLRIVPLYFFVMILMLLIIAIKTNFTLQDSPYKILSNTAKWLLFGVDGFPPINNYKPTKIITAGVTWSLTWEWLFYFLLPFLFLLIIRKKVPIIVLIITGALCIILFKEIGFFYLPFFAGGMIAPFIMKFSKTKINFNNLIGSSPLIVEIKF